MIENNSETSGNKAIAYRYLVIRSFSGKISRFEDAVFKTLNATVCIGVFQPFFGNGGIFFFAFDADVVPPEFLGRNGSCSRTEKRVENDVAGIAGRQNEFGNQFLRFLRRMRRIFRH